MCSQDTNIEQRFTINDLSPDERKAYNELLAQQPQLAKEWEELEKRAGKVRKGTLYAVVENGYKSSLVPSSTS